MVDYSAAEEKWISDYIGKGIEEAVRNGDHITICNIADKKSYPQSVRNAAAGRLTEAVERAIDNCLKEHRPWVIVNFAEWTRLPHNVRVFAAVVALNYYIQNKDERGVFSISLREDIPKAVREIARLMYPVVVSLLSKEGQEAVRHREFVQRDLARRRNVEAERSRRGSALGPRLRQRFANVLRRA